jgi:hypothetical protein
VTLRAPDGVLPTLVEKSRLAIEQEAKSIGPRVKNIFEARTSPSPWDTDENAWKALSEPEATAQRQLAFLGQDQARLTYLNAYDHLVTLGRVLGEDGRVSLFAHTTLGRSVCEAAVRFAWLLDASAPYESRLLRSAVSLYNAALNRAKGAREIPETGHHISGLRPQLIANCEQTVKQVEDTIDAAGITREFGRGTKVARLSMGSTVEPMNFETGPQMQKLLSDFPSLYTTSSAVAHSLPWILDEVRKTRGPDLEMELDLMQVGATAESAISASGLIVKGYAQYYGLDSDPYVRETRQRVGMVDGWMREWARQQGRQPGMQPAPPTVL